MLATELDVARGVGSAFADWDDVIELEVFAGSAVDALARVAPPDLVAHFLGYGMTLELAAWDD